jgi:hypothetical protein
MDATRELAAILRDAREGALLWMRCGIFSQRPTGGSSALKVRSAARVSNHGAICCFN